MAGTDDFVKRVERMVREQLRGQRVGYLLGAGASHLDGQGYPLANELWERIRDRVESSQRAAIQDKLDEGADGLEEALDLLDTGGAADSPHRHSVAAAIGDYFGTLEPPLDAHGDFVARLARRTESAESVFCLNYDPLLERAAERSGVRLVDGFVGAEQAYFDPAVFQEQIGTIQRGRRHPQVRWVTGVIHLFKLHGSVGWYESPSTGIRRCCYTSPIPPGTRRLMVPPQHRKATDTTTPPYAALWSEFRRLLRHGPSPIYRLACVGYGMRDHHVNAVIDNGLARSNLTLLVLARSLTDDIFYHWSPKTNVIIVTRNRCSLYSEVGPGHPDLWNFARLSKEV